MYRSIRVVSPRRIAQLNWPLCKKWSRSLPNKLAHALRVMAPTLFALTFAGVAHAQGTMDFSGAQTLMGTFKTFAVYAGAVKAVPCIHESVDVASVLPREEDEKPSRNTILHGFDQTRYTHQVKQRS